MSFLWLMCAGIMRMSRRVGEKPIMDLLPSILRGYLGTHSLCFVLQELAGQAALELTKCCGQFDVVAATQFLSLFQVKVFTWTAASDWLEAYNNYVKVASDWLILGSVPIFIEGVPS
jgi:hypothetical protein